MTEPHKKCLDLTAFERIDKCVVVSHLRLAADGSIGQKYPAKFAF